MFVTNTVYVERTDSTVQISNKPVDNNPYASGVGPDLLPVTGGQHEIGFKPTDGLLFVVIGIGATLLVQGLIMHIFGLTIVRKHEDVDFGDPCVTCPAKGCDGSACTEYQENFCRAYDCPECPELKDCTHGQINIGL